MVYLIYSPFSYRHKSEAYFDPPDKVTQKFKYLLSPLLPTTFSTSLKQLIQLKPSSETYVENLTMGLVLIETIKIENHPKIVPTSI